MDFFLYKVLCNPNEVLLNDAKCDLLKPGSYSAQQAECVKRGGNSAALTFSSSCIEGGEKDVTWTYVKKRAEGRATIVNDLLHLKVT